MVERTLATRLRASARPDSTAGDSPLDSGTHGVHVACAPIRRGWRWLWSRRSAGSRYPATSRLPGGQRLGTIWLPPANYRVFDLIGGIGVPVRPDGSRSPATVVATPRVGRPGCCHPCRACKRAWPSPARTSPVRPTAASLAARKPRTVEVFALATASLWAASAWDGSA